MSYELLVGLQVSDDALYTQYREAMAPILSVYGGGFRYDFKIASTLKSETKNPINRVFAIYFFDQISKEGFFTDSNYLRVKAEFFEKSVTSTTIISEYLR